MRAPSIAPPEHARIDRNQATRPHRGLRQQAAMHVGRDDVGHTTIRLTGDATRVVAAGGPGSEPTPANRTANATIQIDPRAMLVPASGGPPVGGTGSAPRCRSRR